MDSVHAGLDATTIATRRQQQLTEWIERNEVDIRFALRPIAYKLAPFCGSSNEETLADLHIEVLRRLLEHSEVYVPGHPPYGWILRTAQNVALRWKDDALLARKRWQDLPEALELGDSGQEAEKMINRATAHQILGSLDGIERDLVELFVMQERSAEEVGGLVGLSPVNVRVRWHRLLKKLKAEYTTEERS